MVSKKMNHLSCEDGIEKSTPSNHRLPSLVKPRNAMQIGDVGDRLL